MLEFLATVFLIWVCLAIIAAVLGLINFALWESKTKIPSPITSGCLKNVNLWPNPREDKRG